MATARRATARTSAAGVEPGVESVEGEPVMTCQSATRAWANFASFDPHANRHDKTRDPIYYPRRSLGILLFGVFAFFGIHTAFWLYRELRVKFARRRQRPLMTTATANPAASPEGCARHEPRPALPGASLRSSACCTRC
jgi:hypothetical protein